MQKDCKMRVDAVHNKMKSSMLLGISYDVMESLLDRPASEGSIQTPDLLHLIKVSERE